MNEVEKMYENAEVSGIWVEMFYGVYYEHERRYNSYEEMINNMMETNGWTLMEAQAVAESKCRKEYPPFTAEKQIELIKWLAKSKSDITICYSNATERFAISKRGGYCVSEDFATALAIKINLLWQDLTEEEKQQVKRILE